MTERRPKGALHAAVSFALGVANITNIAGIAGIAGIANITGCDAPAPQTQTETLTIRDVRAWPVPVTDTGATCADVANSRVCWDASCDGGVCVTDRPLPPLPELSSLGWRCTGKGDARVCADRQSEVGRFDCDTDGRCQQRYPRVPDDGEWSCADTAGAVVCAGGAPPAGVASPRLSPTESGWFCGLRKAGTPDEQRVCVDFSTDYPSPPENAKGADGRRHWRCSWKNGSVERTCILASDLHELGDPCDPAVPCVDGASCVNARCVPPRPAPNCAFDADCESRRCRFGTCAEREGETAHKPAPGATPNSPSQKPSQKPTVPTAAPTRHVILTGEGAIRGQRRDTQSNTLSASPPDRVRSVTRTGGALILELAAGTSPIQLAVPGACPVTLQPAKANTGKAETVALAPLFSLGPHRPQVGYDAPFEIAVRANCDSARLGSLDWRQVSGPPLRDLVVSQRGFHLKARTAARREVLPDPLPSDLVPVSPRTRGEVVLAASWKPAAGAAHGGESQGEPIEKRIRIAAAARSRGLPNVPVGVGQVLAGSDWTVVKRPNAGTGNAPGALTPRGDGITTFTPPSPGDWLLQNSAGRQVRLRAGSYDETPLDCSRSPCHITIGKSADASPMTHALTRRLAASPSFAGEDVSCVEGCHTTGELGSLDGGFSHASRAFDTSPFATANWGAVPRPLRRLGGVGCLACHGPGAVPVETDRWTLLRVGVCATCHDAPPRYGHVAAWKTSAMATADRDPRTQEAPCSACHTTWGFLSAQGVGTGRRPPPSAPATGITCVACHAPHQAHRPKDPLSAVGARPNAGLLRQVQVPALLADITQNQQSLGGPCLGCHTPDPATDTPAASSAAIWAARGGLDPHSGQAISGVANPKGCVSCHNLAGPETSTLSRGANHAFAARSAPLRGGVDRNTALRTQAEQLWKRLSKQLAARNVDERASAAPRHAGSLGKQSLNRDTPLGRATYNVLLVIEDPGAGSHNAAYSRELLSSAQRALADPSFQKATP